MRTGLHRAMAPPGSVTEKPTRRGSGAPPRLRDHGSRSPGIALARKADGLYSFLTNAGGARIRGAEAELAVEPVRGLSLTASLGYLDAKLTSDQVLTEFQNATVGGKKGDRLGSAPWSASATAAYLWPVSARWKGLLRADYSYSGKGRVGFTTTDSYYTEYGDFSVLNLRAGVQDDRYGIFLFVQNAGNVNGIASRLSTFGVSNLTFSVPPRTVGVNLRAAY
ncbi:TonB-dependent receptor [Sphingobium sp. DC-2]|uniref:TonB-dependent receptor n=1 Tax=Sphingobium sp. DC-2 TaxID=1303256 RepID=UPI0004C2E16E|nr:TonB-dependent receptor [Sphingobium sp. DC-2]